MCWVCLEIRLIIILKDDSVCYNSVPACRWMGTPMWSVCSSVWPSCRSCPPSTMPSPWRSSQKPPGRGHRLASPATHTANWPHRLSSISSRWVGLSAGGVASSKVELRYLQQGGGSAGGGVASSKVEFRYLQQGGGGVSLGVCVASSKVEFCYLQLGGVFSGGGWGCSEQ